MMNFKIYETNQSRPDFICCPKFALKDRIMRESSRSNSSAKYAVQTQRPKRCELGTFT